MLDTITLTDDTTGDEIEVDVPAGKTLSQADIQGIVQRYRFGKYRDVSESDPTVQGTAAYNAAQKAVAAKAAANSPQAKAAQKQADSNNAAADLTNALKAYPDLDARTKAAQGVFHSIAPGVSKAISSQTSPPVNRFHSHTITQAELKSPPAPVVTNRLNTNRFTDFMGLSTPDERPGYDPNGTHIPSLPDLIGGAVGFPVNVISNVEDIGLQGGAMLNPWLDPTERKTYGDNVSQALENLKSYTPFAPLFQGGAEGFANAFASEDTSLPAEVQGDLGSQSMQTFANNFPQYFAGVKHDPVGSVMRDVLPFAAPYIHAGVEGVKGRIADNNFLNKAFGEGPVAKPYEDAWQSLRDQQAQQRLLARQYPPPGPTETPTTIAPPVTPPAPEPGMQQPAPPAGWVNPRSFAPPPGPILPETPMQTGGTNRQLEDFELHSYRNIADTLDEGGLSSKNLRTVLDSGNPTWQATQDALDLDYATKPDPTVSERAIARMQARATQAAPPITPYDMEVSPNAPNAPQSLPQLSDTIPDAVSATTAPENVDIPTSGKSGVPRGEAITAAGTTVPYQWEAVPLSSLTASHTPSLGENPAFPQELQPRDRTGNPISHGQIDSIAQNLDPQQLGESRQASTGAPIIGPEADNIVESGNGRTIALQRIFGEKGFEKQRQAYQDFVRAQAAHLGVSIPSGMENPVLVRRRTSDLNPEQRSALAREMNQDSVMRSDAAETAKSDAATLRESGVLGQLIPTSDGDLFSASNVPFIRSFFNRISNGKLSTLSGLVNPDTGGISPEGARRLQNAILGAVYGDAAPLLRSLTMGGGEASTRLGIAVQNSATSLARAMHDVGSIVGKDAMQASNIAPSVADAMRVITSAQKMGTDIKGGIAEQVKAYLSGEDNNGNLFEGDGGSASTRKTPQLTRDLVSLLTDQGEKKPFYRNSELKQRQLLQNYANAWKESAQPGDLMNPEGHTGTVHDLLQEADNRTRAENGLPPRGQEGETQGGLFDANVRDTNTVASNEANRTALENVRSGDNTITEQNGKQAPSVNSGDMGKAQIEAAASALTLKPEGGPTDASEALSSVKEAGTTGGEAAARAKIAQARDAAYARMAARAKGAGGQLYDATSTVALIAQEFADAVIIGASHIADGALTFKDFSGRMIADLGDRIRPYLDMLWSESKGQYESNIKPGLGQNAPEIIPTVADYLPNYHSDKYQGSQQLVDAIKESALRLAADNRVAAVRGGEGREGVKALATTKQEAQALDLNPSDIARLQAAHIPLDTYTRAVEAMRGEWVTRAADAAKAKAKYAESDMSPDAVSARLEVAHTMAISDMVSLESMRNKTELGRAFRNLQEAAFARNKAVPAVQEFARIYGEDALHTPAAPLKAPADFESGAKFYPEPHAVTKPVARVESNTRDAATQVGTADLAPRITDAASARKAREGKASAFGGKKQRRIDTKDAKIAPSAVDLLGPDQARYGDAPKGPPVRRAAFGKESAVESKPPVRGPRAGSIRDTIEKTPALKTERDAALAQLLSGIKKLSGQASAGIPLNEEIIQGAGRLAAVYIKAGVKTFAEFQTAVRDYYKAELPEDVMRSGWERAGGKADSPNRLSATGETPRNMPAVTPPLGLEDTGATAHRTSRVQDLGQQSAGMDPSPLAANAGGEAGFNRVRDLGEQAAQMPPVTGGGGELGFNRTRDLGEEAANMPPSPLAANAGGEAGELGGGPDATQTRLPDSGSGPGVHIFLPDRALAVQRRLIDTYETPENINREPKTGQLLAELGGFLHANGVKNYHEWAIRMNDALGTKIAPTDLKAAWEAFKPLAWERVRQGKALHNDAMQTAYQTIAVHKDAKAAIEEMAQVDSSAPDATAQYGRILDKYRKAAPELTLGDVTGILRSLKTSFNIHMFARHGGFFTLNPFNIKKSAPLFRDAIKAYANKEFGDEVLRGIHASPDYPIYRLSGLKMTNFAGDEHGLLAGEKGYMSAILKNMAEEGYRTGNSGRDIARALPRYTARGIEASERSSAVILNSIRSHMMSQSIGELMKAGYTPEIYPEMYKARANFINDATGRAYLGKTLDSSANALSQVFFSARYPVSRIKLITAPFVRLAPSAIADAIGRPYAYEKGYIPAPVRRQIIRDYGGYMTGLMGLYGAMALAGGTVNLKPWNQDFMTARFGDTRIDLTGSGRIWLRLLSQQLARGRETGQGKFISYGNNFGQEKPTEGIEDVLRNQEHPAIKFVSDAWNGEDMMGNPRFRGSVRDIAGDTIETMAPMQIESAMDGYKEAGIMGAIASQLDTVGVGVNSYDSSIRRPERQHARD